MEEFPKLFGDLVAFAYHCFDRIVILGYLPFLTRAAAPPAFPEVVTTSLLQPRVWRAVNFKIGNCLATPNLRPASLTRRHGCERTPKRLEDRRRYTNPRSSSFAGKRAFPLARR
jgi:hypothetical protein